MITLIFWSSIFLIAFIYFGYPLVIFVVSVFFKKKHAVDDAFVPFVTLFVVAYNER